MGDRSGYSVAPRRLTSLRLLPAVQWRVRPRALAAFALRFLIQSVSAGIDVAWRAFSPRPSSRPGFAVYRSRLLQGQAQTAFCTVMSLVPGTLPSGRSENGGGVIHCLDVEQPVLAQSMVEEELLTFSAVPLVSLDGRSEALQAALRYLLFALHGSILYLAGTVLLYGSYGTLDIVLLAERVHPQLPTLVAAALMTVGLLAKTALFPLHLWLPPAHSSAPAAASAVLSALVVKGSFFLVVRLWFDVMPGLTGYVGTKVLGAMGAAAILFGLIYTALGHDRIGGLAGLGRALPMSVLAFALTGVALIGVPPSGASLAKDLFLQASAETERWWWAFFVQAGGVLTSSYIVLVLAHALAPAEAPRAPHAHVPRSAEAAALALALCSLLLGLFLWEAYPSVRRGTSASSSALESLASAVWPILAGAVLAMLLGPGEPDRHMARL